MQQALVLVAVLVIALYITSKRFQHKYHPKPLRKLLGQEDKPH